MVKTYWINPQEKGDTFIVIGDQMIYKGRPKPELEHEYTQQIKSGLIPEKLMGMPFSYIKCFQYREGQDWITILHGKNSKEKIHIQSQQRIVEIMQCLADEFPNSKYAIEAWSRFKSVKGYMVTLFLIGAFFVLTLVSALELEKGRIPVPNLVYIIAIASLGAINVTLIFSLPILFNVYQGLRALRNPPVVHTLKRNTASQIEGSNKS